MHVNYKHTTILLAILLFSLVTVITVMASTGTTDSTSAPGATNSYTLEDIYNRINNGTAGTQSTFTEPVVAPGTGTMKTLNDIYDLASDRSRPTKTGQTAVIASGDDGDLEKGVAWPSPRFTDNNDGTVTDNLTGLIWLKDANCIATQYSSFDNDDPAGDGEVTWQHALDFVAGINAGTYPNCGASQTDWRLPNVRELHSLVHFGFYVYAVPNTAGTGKWTSGDPFTNILGDYYWSASSYAGSTSHAFGVKFATGWVYFFGKSDSYGVWPIRGGQ